jgi:hypothetical protein
VRRPDSWTCPHCRVTYLASKSEPRFPKGTLGVWCEACSSGDITPLQWKLGMITLGVIIIGIVKWWQ